MSDNPLTDAAASGLYHLPPSRLPIVESAACGAHFCLLKADIAEPAPVENVLSQLGSALKFPIWYGANFDALYDCLCDPDWQPATGHVLLINGMARLRATDPDDFTTLIEVFQAVAEARRERLEPFWILIDTPARGIPAFPEA
ncbi:MAG: barstar family protein [Azonexus sp.]|nr:barstar family protein [Azonexus sp.]